MWALGQRHGLQSTTLTFFIKKYLSKIYIYIYIYMCVCAYFYESNFEEAVQIYRYDFHISEFNDLEVIHSLYSYNVCLTEPFPKGHLFVVYGGSMYI
jgi:hypothetical protein